MENTALMPAQHTLSSAFSCVVYTCQGGSEGERERERGEGETGNGMVKVKGVGERGVVVEGSVREQIVSNRSCM